MSNYERPVTIHKFPATSDLPRRAVVGTAGELLSMITPQAPGSQPIQAPQRLRVSDALHPVR
jgi:hypothetical protein